MAHTSSFSRETKRHIGSIIIHSALTITMEQSIDPSYKRFRPLAMILETIPFLVILAGYLLDIHQLKIIGVFLAVGVYILGGWFLFKGQNHNIWQILIATVAGFFLSVVILGFLFEELKWEFGKEMVLVSTFTLNFCFSLSLLYMTLRLMSSKSRPYQFSMSVKIFSRFFLLVIFLYASGLNVHMEQILAQ